MKRILLTLGIIAALMSSCTTQKQVARSEAYKGMYDQQLLTVLLMPPINRSTNVEAKEYFHSTLNVPIANAGYYVVPPFLSMEILKKESAYDTELFLNGSLNKFGEIFGADLALFTIIHRWDKSSIGAKVNVEVEYIIKSTLTNEELYSRRGEVTYDTSINSGSSTGLGILVSMAASAINTAATKYVDVARTCNAYTFKDLPAGKYSPDFGKDGDQLAGQKAFKVVLNSKYK
jgi:hypothetical protein